MYCTKIAFVSRRDGVREIYVMDVDGRNAKRLTEQAGRNFYPAWSPDGFRLAFMSDRAGDEALYVMNQDGTEPTRITEQR